METIKFNKYEYQNLICEYELSGLEMRILIRLSNCYGRDGLICPSNAKLAIWLKKITQEEYDKKDKTPEEQAKIRTAKGSLKNAMKKLSDKKFILTELKGNSRKIYLLKPDDPSIRYEGSSDYDPLNKGGHQIMTPGHQTMTPRSSNDDPPIINNKTSIKIKPAPAKAAQVTTLMFRVPKDIRSDITKRSATAKIIKIGINQIGFEPMSELIAQTAIGSHQDFVGILENKLNEFRN